MHWPELAGVVQPLAGEYAARRSLLERLPFPTGYGVELGLLVDTWELAGLDAIAQVDLGRRVHRHHDDLRLGRMASEIMQVALARLERQGRLRLPEPPNPTLSQFDVDAEGRRTVTTHDVGLVERPPMASVPEYARRAGRAS
jgi:glucosyl-3-phosphoglycerate synthase